MQIAGLPALTELYWGEGSFSSKTETKTLTLPSPGIPGEGKAANAIALCSLSPVLGGEGWGGLMKTI